MIEYAKCCEQGKGEVCRWEGRDGNWVFWPHYMCDDVTQISYCPFCGHDLSKPAYASLEEALTSLLISPPLYLCFDVDGVLCDDRDQSVPYGHRKPYPWVADTLGKLKAAGHTIRIQTARYMARFDGNQKKANEYGYAELVFWLLDNSIPYDEVYMGKCSANIYFDDRGCRVESNEGITHWLSSVLPTIAETQCRRTPTTASADTSTKSSSP